MKKPSESVRFCSITSHPQIVAWNNIIYLAHDPMHHKFGMGIAGQFLLSLVLNLCFCGQLPLIWELAGLGCCQLGGLISALCGPSFSQILPWAFCTWWLDRVPRKRAIVCKAPEVQSQNWLTVTSAALYWPKQIPGQPRLGSLEIDSWSWWELQQRHMQRM